MKVISSNLLGEAAWSGVKAYSRMAGLLVAPEAYIQTFVANYIYEATSCRVSIELPMRTLLHEWGASRSDLDGLGNFRVDMAVYEPSLDDRVVGLNNLVEFKLWTDRNHVARDVRRIKKIIKAVGNIGGDFGEIGGHVLVCPQFHQGIQAVTCAMNDFGERFPLSYIKLETVRPENGINYGVGIGVIDVDQCRDGNYG